MYDISGILHHQLSCLTLPISTSPDNHTPYRFPPVQREPRREGIDHHKPQQFKLFWAIYAPADLSVSRTTQSIGGIYTETHISGSSSNFPLVSSERYLVRRHLYGSVLSATSPFAPYVPPVSYYIRAVASCCDLLRPSGRAGAATATSCLPLDSRRFHRSTIKNP